MRWIDWRYTTRKQKTANRQNMHSTQHNTQILRGNPNPGENHGRTDLHYNSGCTRERKTDYNLQPLHKRVFPLGFRQQVPIRLCLRTSSHFLARVTHSLLISVRTQKLYSVCIMHKVCLAAWVYIPQHVQISSTGFPSPYLRGAFQVPEYPLHCCPMFSTWITRVLAYCSHNKCYVSYKL